MFNLKEPHALTKIKPEQILLENESKQKIGAVTYVVTAHFDDTRESLNRKIINLLRGELNRQISAGQIGRKQGKAV